MRRFELGTADQKGGQSARALADKRHLNHEKAQRDTAEARRFAERDLAGYPRTSTNCGSLCKQLARKRLQIHNPQVKGTFTSGISYHSTPLSLERQRYRLLDLERLSWRLRTDDLEAVGQNLAAVLKEMIARDQIQRQATWTESLAFGGIGFVERIQPLTLSRMETELVEAAEGLGAARGGNSLRAERGLKSARKPLN